MSRLSAESKERQVSTLLYTLGEDAEDVLSSTNILEDNRKKYREVMSKLDSFFQVRKNVIYRFNWRMQLADESIEQFITNLYQVVGHCQYGNLRDKMINDCIIVGIRDSALSKRLQMDPRPDLTLGKVKKLVRPREAVHKQQQFVAFVYLFSATVLRNCLHCCSFTGLSCEELLLFMYYLSLAH